MKRKVCWPSHCLNTHASPVTEACNAPCPQFQPPTSTAGGAAAGAAGSLSATRTVAAVRRPFKLPALRPVAPMPPPTTTLPDSSAPKQHQGEQAPTPLPAATQAAAMAADSTSSTGEPPACQLLLLQPEEPAPGASAPAPLPKIKLPGLRAKKKFDVAAVAAEAAGPQAAVSPALDHRQPGDMAASGRMRAPAAPAMPATAASPPAAVPAAPAGVAGAAAAAPTGWRVQRLPAVLPEELPAVPQARCLPHAVQLLSKRVLAGKQRIAMQQTTEPAGEAQLADTPPVPDLPHSLLCLAMQAGHLPSLPVSAASQVPLDHPGLGDLATLALQLEGQVLPQLVPSAGGSGGGALARGVISSQVGACPGVPG